MNTNKYHFYLNNEEARMNFLIFLIVYMAIGCNAISVEVKSNLIKSSEESHAAAVSEIPIIGQIPLIGPVINGVVSIIPKPIPKRIEFDVPFPISFFGKK